jgi:pheromone shutdown protein TraB
MLPDTAAAPSSTLAQTPRNRLAGLVQVVSLATFLSAAACMLLAGALHSAGRAGTSSLLATLGYALGVAGITAGVLALALESPTDSDTPQETP